MKLHFLGGADEIGASCILIEAAGKRVLVDAGVRMGAAAKDRLPDLAQASDLGGLDAIVVTHAHLDHTGALPLVHGAFPRTDVLMTEPTLGILRILLLDALKIMEQKSEREGEIPLYPLPAVESLLARATATRFLEPVPICEGAIRVTFFPAGHVLGAAAVGLETDEGNVLVTGDLSVTDQLTVPGMPRPRFAPDVMICESTYGARLHASRRAEEERLVQRVLEVLRDGGKVLIPAFALGRAQEVILILRKGLARPDAPAATVYCDGMVRSICGVYNQYPEYLTRALRDRAQAGRGLFYTADGRIRPVLSPAEREEIVRGDPCVIVSSSGMLSGGPSQQYAAALAASESALITITGYQDEEAPGRRLQELARGASSELFLDGRPVSVRCQVGTYALSAHADAQELTGLVQSLDPREVILVHGDQAPRQGLADRLLEAGCQRVSLPATGDTLSIDAGGSERRRSGRVVRGIGAGRPLEADGLAELHRHLWSNEPRGRTYTAADLATSWYGSQAVPGDLGPIHAILGAEQAFFEPDAKRPFLYRSADPERTRPAARATGSARDEHGRLEQNAALGRVETLLGPESGLYKKGADRETWTLRLAFHFPDVARERHAETMATLQAETGWAVAVHPEPRLASLEQLAVELLAPAVKPLRAPSIHKDERRVEVVVAELPPPELVGQASQRFVDQTGYTLALKHKPCQAPVAKQVFDDTGRMEINHAFAEIDRAFTGRDHSPSKKSKKADADGPLIELNFISPEIGGRYEEILDDLAYRTSWRILIAPKVNQQAVLEKVRALIPETWRVTKGPGLDLASRKVHLRLAQPPAEQELTALSDNLQQATGFTVELRVA